MLTKTETEYLENIEAFEDTHGLRYAKVVRSRIRKRVERAVKDLIYIIEKDRSHRTPAENYRRRTAKNLHGRNFNLTVTAQDINAFKRRSGGNTEKRIIGSDEEMRLINMFLFHLAMHNSYLVSSYKRSLDDGKKRREDEIEASNKKYLLEKYRKNWKTLDNQQLKQVLLVEGFPSGLFNDEDECIVWLRRQE